MLGSHTKATGILRNRIYKGVDTWNKRAGKKRPGTGKRVQRLRPESEWIGFSDESIRIVDDELFDRVQTRLRLARARTNPENRMGRLPKYLFSGLLKCASCGGNYSERNGKHHACSSQSNGRDSLCSQKKLIRKDTVEFELLADIKRQLLEPNFVKEVTRRIKSELRQNPEERVSLPDIEVLDRQIGDIAQTICDVGRSDILTMKLQDFEDRRLALAQDLDRNANGVDFSALANASDKWREIVTNLENLHKYAKPDEVEAARQALSGIIGQVNVVYNSGAQKRT